MIIATEGWERHSYLNIPVQQQRESWAETENILAKEIHTLLLNLDLQYIQSKTETARGAKSSKHTNVPPIIQNATIGILLKW